MAGLIINLNKKNVLQQIMIKKLVKNKNANTYRASHLIVNPSIFQTAAPLLTATLLITKKTF